MKWIYRIGIVLAWVSGFFLLAIGEGVEGPLYLILGWSMLTYAKQEYPNEF